MSGTSSPALRGPRRRLMPRYLGVSVLLWAVLAIFAILAIIGWAVLLVPSLSSLWTDQSLRSTFLPPFSDGFPLGTDNLGRNFAWRLIAGIGVSVFVGALVAVISVTLGLALGIFAGYFGRAADAGTNVVIDVTWAFPEILLAIVLAGVLGPGLEAVILALSLTGWAAFARIVRGEVLSLRERDYVAASRVLGYGKVRISVRHLLPNLIPITLVMTVYFMAVAIVAEAGLSFLGLGAQPPTPSLGGILSQGRDYLNSSWWPVVLAGLALSLMVLTLNYVSDGLRDHLDPRVGGRR
ncbi:MAG: ABC transporter permease [Actinomycetales bacterium]|nr:ABC transporter permease [Actinomycetales bacterium]